MQLFPHLSPGWYMIPLVLLLTAQLIWLICRYAPVTRKDYALFDRRRAWLALSAMGVVYLTAILCLLPRFGLGFAWEENMIPALTAAITFGMVYPRPESPAYRKKGRGAFRLLSAFSAGFGLLGWLA